MPLRPGEAEQILKGYLNTIGEQISRETRVRTLNRQEDPEGKPYKDLSKAYKKVKIKSKGTAYPILQGETGRLINQITHRVEEGLFYSVIIHTTVDYGIYHQLGGPKIPKRSFMDTKGINKKENEIFDRNIDRYFEIVSDKIL